MTLRSAPVVDDVVATPDMVPIAWVVGVQSHQLKVRCPFCDRIHFHGIALGSRIAHCHFGYEVTNAGQLGHVYYLELSPGLSAKARAALVRVGLLRSA